ncbi:LysM peptidoglycan-binding domain-containing protein [Aquibacillus halophilus]|uniref:LysM peptidoglycan-binding domain-containing protein n=1 Tax=Aquibacillus halophilus TaxID=930132 RepID=A0A6A8DM47_9BACI|nr:3D domain-containing protein [Aquibacillus halophilus]MRH44087.1 LysM peptidoglycan-binding domain-containing protein [Aquibacillus halophilus]
MKKTVVSIAMSIFIVSMAAIPASAQEYQVVKGDSLWEIAQGHQISVDRIMKVNQLDTDIIYPKQMLQLDIDEIHVVAKGETLSEIASKYEVSIEDLKIWNGLSSDIIVNGEKITIKSNLGSINERNANQIESDIKKNKKVEKPEVVKENKPETTNQPDQQPEKQSNQPEPKAEKQAAQPKQKSNEQSNKQLTMTATAYTAECAGCSGITATGLDLNNNRNMKVIAVDPNVIPLGTRVHVEGYGEAIAGDTGGAIKGNKIDIHLPTKTEAFAWGVKTVKVTIL